MHNKKNLIKRVIDVCMTVVLLFLMAYQVTGEALHEWLGIAMTVLVILHHLINIKWYKKLFKGTYHSYRKVITCINMLLMAAIILTAFCGMSMSAHAVPFLNGMAPVSLARQLHLAMSYWSFALMGIHLGLHIRMLFSTLKCGENARKVFNVLWCAAAVIGLWLIIKNSILGYMFFLVPFAMFDYSMPQVLVLLMNIVMLLSFSFAGYEWSLMLTKKKEK
ncbi:MAG: hypothetical protein K6G26_11620 [Lachnospiraceae bacterium]|nr:hypothetical protein [Lachnospiraceae bacterium]